MQDSQERETEPSLASGVSGFLAKNAKLVVGILVAGLAVAVVIGIVTVVSSSGKRALPELGEKVESDYQSWIAEQDSVKKADTEKAIHDAFSRLEREAGSSFSYQRALMVEAALAFEKKEYAIAMERWNAVATKFPSSYLAPIALRNYAVAAEEAGESQKAIDAYTGLTTKFKEKVPGIAHAYWALGRLHEASGKKAEALAFYKTLLEKHADDGNWTKLAESRIIYLESQGL